MNPTQKITPCLWFDMNCEEAITFYTSIFPNSKISHIQRYPEGMTEEPMQGMSGKIVTAIFTINGLEFQALDGGPTFKKNPSVSFFVNFDPSSNPQAQKDLDTLWSKLTEGGTVRMEKQEYPFSKLYGWVEDRFGVNWQLILSDPNGEPRPAIVPSLLFTKAMSGKAEEAAHFYISVFKNSKIGTIAHYPDGMPGGVQGGVMYSDFMLENQWFSAMDGGQEHDFEFNEGISFSIDTKDQAETDYFWDKLRGGGGVESQCGWLKDRYGMSWQVVPHRLGELLSSPDTEKANRAMSAMLTMQKIDIAAIEAAYNG